MDRERFADRFFINLWVGLYMLLLLLCGAASAFIIKHGPNLSDKLGVML